MYIAFYIIILLTKNMKMIYIRPDHTSKSICFLKYRLHKSQNVS